MPLGTLQKFQAMADEIHHSAIVIDTHADTAQRFVDEAWNFSDELGEGHLNLASARTGKLTAEFFAIWAEPVQWAGRFAHRTLELIDAVHEQVRRSSGNLALCLTADDILQAYEADRFAVLLGIEGGHAIENSLALLRTYYRLGVRYMTLTWANSNDWADSSSDLSDPSVVHHGGLSPFGEEVIREMNRLGMLVDVSHISDETLAHVLRCSTAPVLASHSGARALTDAHRNLTDDQLRAIAESGGAIMVNFYSAFIDERWRQAWTALEEERHAQQQTVEKQFRARGLPVPHFAANAIDRNFASRIPRPPLRSLIDHIDHIAKIAGVAHVGIGTDFDGISATPEGIDCAADLPKITAALAARGYTRGDLHMILGGNLLRVLRAAQAAATTG